MFVLIVLLVVAGWIFYVVHNSKPAPNNIPDQNAQPENVSIKTEKTCPRCAETVKAAAKACRFCGQTFEISSVSGAKPLLGHPVNVTLVDIGPLKINVIKEIRQELGIGLKEAKDLAESAPVVLARHLSVTEAERLCAVLRTVRATATITAS